MQTEMITQVKKFKLEFEKFDDWVYIKCSDRKDPYLLPRKYFDKMEVEQFFAKEGPYHWLLQIEWQDAYVALSKDYLKQYFKTGDWGPDYNTWIVDPLPLLKAGGKDCYYQANVTVDGFLRFDGKYVRRPFPIELRRYHSKEEVVKKLQKNPKVLKAEIKPYNCYCYESCNCEKHIIHIVYMPSVVEFNRFVKEAKVDTNHAEYDIEQRLGIEKFKKKEDY